MNLLAKSLSVLFLGAYVGLNAQSAADVETKSYGSYAGGKFDTVDLATGNLYINIPLISYPQLGKLKPLSFAIELNNAPYTQFGYCTTDNDVDDCHIVAARYDTAPPGGMSAGTSMYPQVSSFHNIGAYVTSSYEAPIVTGALDYPSAAAPYLSYSLVDPSGNSHELQSELGSQHKYHATDGSGYTFIAAGTDPAYDNFAPDNDFVSTNSGSQAPASAYWLSEYSSITGFTGGVRLGDVIDPSGIRYANQLYTSSVPAVTKQPNPYIGPEIPTILTSTVTDPFGNHVKRGPWFWSNHQPEQMASVQAFQAAQGSTGPQGLKYIDSVGRNIPDILSIQGTLGTSASPQGGVCNFAGSSFSIPWLVPGPNNTSMTYNLSYSSHAYYRTWPKDPTGRFVGDQSYTCGYALDSVLLPNNTSWVFHYDQNNNFDLNQVDLPTGGHVVYSYIDLDNIEAVGGNRCSAQCHAVYTRTEDDGVSWSATTTYNYGTIANSGGGPEIGYTEAFYTIENTVQTGSTTPGNDTVHVFSSIANLDAPHIYEGQTDFYQGSSSSIDYSLGAPTSPSATLLRRVNTSYEFQPAIPYDAHNDIVDTLPASVTTWTPGSTWTSGSLKTITREYPALFNAVLMHCTYPSGPTSCKPVSDAHNTTISPTIKYVSPHEEDEYSGATANASSLYLTTATTFEFELDQGTLDANMLTLPGSSITTDSQNHEIQGTTFGYDAGSGPAQNGACPTPTVGPYGLLTSVLKDVSVSDPHPTETDYTYNCFGMPVDVTDPLGFHTTITAYQNIGQYPGLYPMTIQRTTTNGSPHVESYSNDPVTGEVTSHTDENGQTTSYRYDNMGRPSYVTTPDGGGVAYCYTDVGGTCSPSSAPYSVIATTKVNAGLSVSSRTDSDGLGRAKHTINFWNTPDQSEVDTTYDPMGRVQSTSNAYLSAASTTGYTTYTYDALGRAVRVQLPDGNSRWSCYDNIQTAGQPNCTIRLGTPMLASWVDSTDEKGNHSQQVSDVFGRLARVFEPNPASNAPSLETDYQYDGLNNLTQVDQWGAAAGSPGDRVRTFQYDYLSRLTASSNPETGPVSYLYDDNGNMTSSTDGMGTTTYYYDALNRVTDAFGGGTYHHYGYDNHTDVNHQSQNAIGRLTWATNDVNADEVFSYDVMGRLNWQTNFTPSSPNRTDIITTAMYDYAGNMTDLTYPDGRHITQSLDSVGRLNSVALSSFAGQSGGSNYLRSMAYNPDGSVSAMTLGNGVVQSSTYNNRSQLCESNATYPSLQGGSTVTALDRQYFYDSQSSLCGSTPNNNGNIASIADAVNVNKTQGFQYDALNRLTTASRSDGAYFHNYTMDAFGNNSTDNPLVSFPAADNRMQVATNGYTYDAIGRVIDTGLVWAGGHHYTFDGLNQMTQVDYGGANYTYDARGIRIRKDVGGVWNNYWNAGGTWNEYVDFGGTPIAEKHMDGTWSDFIYAGGQKVARAESGDQRLHVQGTRCGDGCGWQWTTTSPPVDLHNIVIQPGDRFAWSQYATAGTAAGFGLNFTDGSYAAGLPLADQDGQPTTADGVTGAWHNRVVDLSSQAGKTIDFTYFMTDGETAAGDWSVDYRDVVFLRADGTVTGLYHGESPSVWGTGGMSNLASSAVTQGSLGGLPLTRFYLADHLGSARMEFAGGGWPVWSGDFDPYGQEIQPQTTVNNYKFTGYERDGETGLDQAGARYYTSSMGRFMSPDPSGLAYASLFNPQSFNLYSYVRNNPLSNIDPSGMECVWDDGSYDSADDPDTGSKSQCEGGSTGGHWIDPDQFAELGYSGSSGQADSWLADMVTTTQATAFGGEWAAGQQVDEALSYFYGNGAKPTLIYGNDSPFTLSFKKSLGMQAIIDGIKGKCSVTSGSVGVGTFDAFVNTMMDGPYMTANNGTTLTGYYTPEAQMGAFSSTFSRSGGVVNITISNDITLNSLAFHVPGIFGIPNPASGPLGTVTQRINMTAADPCS